MGPYGRLVIFNDIARLWPVATKDGVSVAHRIKIPRGIKQLGADMVIQAANRQLRSVGDGTTLTCVLASAFSQYIRKHGDIDDVIIDTLINRIRISSHKIKSEQQLIETATVSANNDDTLGTLVGSAVWKTGIDGVVVAAREFGGGTRVEYESGYNFKSGIAYSEFVNAKSGGFESRKCYAIVTDNELAWGRQVVSGITKILNNEEYQTNPLPIVIFAPVIRDEALAVIVKNFTEKKAALVPIVPEGEQNSSESDWCLADIAAITGANLISSKAGKRFEDLSFSDLGTIDRIQSRSNSTVIVNESSDISARIDFLETVMASEPETLKYELSKRSKARLSGAVATIHVGGENDTEINERLDRVDDSIRATKAALANGVVDGGGMALLRAAYSMTHSKINGNKLSSELFNTLIEPVNRIFKNADKNPKKIIKKSIKLINDNRNVGYDVETSSVTSESMTEMGITDPLDVITNALKNALSVARTINRCAVSISDIEEKINEN